MAFQAKEAARDERGGGGRVTDRSCLGTETKEVNTHFLFISASKRISHNSPREAKEKKETASPHTRAYVASSGDWDRASGNRRKTGNGTERTSAGETQETREKPWGGKGPSRFFCGVRKNRPAPQPPGREPGSAGPSRPSKGTPGAIKRGAIKTRQKKRLAAQTPPRAAEVREGARTRTQNSASRRATHAALKRVRTPWVASKRLLYPPRRACSCSSIGWHCVTWCSAGESLHHK